MEIGPLSEWVTAVAEILAVSVALFMPHFSDRKKNRLKNLKFKKIIRSYTNQAIKGNLDAIKELDTFLKIAFIMANTQDDQVILAIGQEISGLLKEEKNEEVRNLLKEL